VRFHKWGRERRGLTLVEILVAIALAMVILGAVTTTMIQVLQISRDSEVGLDAVANARAALETLSNEIKGASRVPGLTRFVGENVPLSFGDGKDNDGDGSIDEETPNGYDDDGDWSTSPANDLHARFVFSRERPHRVGIPDWGDIGVDEDCKFDLDRLTFRSVPAAPADFVFEDVHYEVTDFQGKSRVLVRGSEKLMADTTTIEVTTAPLAYNVLSFNLLYWNPNATPENQYWVESWDSAGPFEAPGFELPAAVAAEITVYADPRGIAAYTDGMPVETQTLRTVIDIENVIQDAAYPRSP
jgi:type II secretory pathway pseudopilin PulG